MASSIEAVATVPQPHTFSHSKDDILSALAFYFGAPSSPEKLRDYSEHHAATYHFPDAYAGSNTQLRDTVNNLIEKSPQQWHTTIGLPFRKIEGTVVEWDEIRFDVRLMQRVPYEGVSRMTSSMKRKHRDRVVRRGLGMLIESDFYTTAAGREHFANQLTSIRYCVQETCNYDVIFAYLTAANYDFAYDKRHQVRPKRNVRMAMQNEVAAYAACQKDERGLDKAVEDAKYRMKRYGVTPNLLVIPPQMSLYMALAPDEKITYKEGGPAALTAFEAGAEGFETKAFRGCGIVTSDPFEVSDEQEAVQMLERFTQVGEFYVVTMPDTVKPGTTGFMDILLYDEEKDRHVKIGFRRALLATGLFVDTPGGGDLTRRAAAGDGVTQDLVNALDAANAAVITMAKGKTLAAWATAAIALEVDNRVGAGGEVGTATVTLVSTLRTAHGSVASLVLSRPFIEHAMLSAVIAVSGGDTGATVFGPSDMQISANTSVKTIEGHYTGHFKAMVSKPQNVFVLRDVMANGYRMGGGTKFFGNTMDEIRKALQERLMNAEDIPGEASSILAFPMETEQYEDGHMDTVMSVTSRLLPWETGTTNEHKSFPGGEEMFALYNGMIGLRQVHFGEDIRASENMDYISQGSTNNATCFIGPHRTWHATNENYSNLIPGQGHWGPDARPGDARWRRGESVSLISARESMMSYEQLAHIPKPKA